MAKKSEIDGLKTSRQKYKDVKWGRMFVDRIQITSEAFRDLTTAAACQVFMIFLYKCQMEQIDGKPKRKDGWIIANNGEIQFTYDEALEKWGIKQKRFTKAIDELVRVGLIDITKSGFGLKKDKSLYAISDRWEKFGTDEFVVKERQKRKQQLGFTNKNKHGQNCNRQKQNERLSVTVEQQP